MDDICHVLIVIPLGSNIVWEKTERQFAVKNTLNQLPLLHYFQNKLLLPGVTRSWLQSSLVLYAGYFPCNGFCSKLNSPFAIWTTLFIVCLILRLVCSEFCNCTAYLHKHRAGMQTYRCVVPVVLLAAIGVNHGPELAMPAFKIAMNLSPLHWCLKHFMDCFWKALLN